MSPRLSGADSGLRKAFAESWTQVPRSYAFLSSEYLSLLGIMTCLLSVSATRRFFLSKDLALSISELQGLPLCNRVCGHFFFFFFLRDSGARTDIL